MALGRPQALGRAFFCRRSLAVSSRHGRNTTRSAHRVPHHALNLAILVRGATGYDGDMTVPAPGSTDYASEMGRLVTGLRVGVGECLGSARAARSHALTYFTAIRL
jgi:hypothetical protein